MANTRILFATAVLLVFAACSGDQAPLGQVQTLPQFVPIPHDTVVPNSPIFWQPKRIKFRYNSHANSTLYYTKGLDLYGPSVQCNNPNMYLTWTVVGSTQHSETLQFETNGQIYTGTCSVWADQFIHSKQVFAYLTVKVT